MMLMCMLVGALMQLLGGVKMGMGDRVKIGGASDSKE